MHNAVSGRFRAGLSGLSRQISAYRFPQSCNLGGMSMNIHRKNSAYHSVCKVNANRLFSSALLNYYIQEMASHDYYKIRSQDLHPQNFKNTHL